MNIRCLVCSGFIFLFTSYVVAETVYVTLEKDNALAIVDPLAGKLINTVTIGQRPRGIALSKDQKTLYIATSDDDTIVVFDTDTLSVVDTLPSGEDPETFALNPPGNRRYVSNEDDNLVTVIDIARPAVHELESCSSATRRPR